MVVEEVEERLSSLAFTCDENIRTIAVNLIVFTHLINERMWRITKTALIISRKSTKISNKVSNIMFLSILKTDATCN